MINKYYPKGYQGSEKDNEVKGNGNHYTTEFRQLDPRLGRWFSVDPLAAQFPWQSPYMSMDGNPVNLNDIAGLAAEGGGVTLDSETNTATVTMTYHVYGKNTLDQADLDGRMVSLQNELNKNPSSIKIDGVEYQVNFKVNAVKLTDTKSEDGKITKTSTQKAHELAKNNTGNSFDPSMNFVRVDTDNESENGSAQNSLERSISITDNGTVNGSKRLNFGPDNSIMMSQEQFLDTKNMVLEHEIVAHGFVGRERNKTISSNSPHIRDYNENLGTTPSIRTTRQTRNVPKEFSSGETKTDKSGVTHNLLDNSKRSILTIDKNLMKFKRVKVNGKTSWYTGGVTNSVFDKKGSTTIYKTP